MTKMKKSSYATPAIKVVAFQVEEGFQGTGDYKIGLRGTSEVDPVQGLQDYQMLDPTELQGWTVR